MLLVASLYQRTHARHCPQVRQELSEFLRFSFSVFLRFSAL
jgi:hypothetical protein